MRSSPWNSARGTARGLIWEISVQTVADYVNSTDGSELASDFLSKADPWVIAQPIAHGCQVVTHEVRPGDGSRKVKIPSVCDRPAGPLELVSATPAATPAPTSAVVDAQYAPAGASAGPDLGDKPSAVESQECNGESMRPAAEWPPSNRYLRPCSSPE